MKKLITLVASLLAVALLTVPVFAAENQSLAVDITKISISNEANNDLLNAATESSPVNGTRITTWDNTGHATQRWDYSESVPGKPQHYWLKNSAVKLRRKITHTFFIHKTFGKYFSKTIHKQVIKCRKLVPLKHLHVYNNIIKYETEHKRASACTAHDLSFQFYQSVHYSQHRPSS